MVRVIPTQNLTFTHPVVASQMLHVYEKDGSISDKTAQDVSAGSQRKAEWYCISKDSGHSSYTAMIKNRTSKRPTGCPTCVGQRIEAGINDLGTTHSKIASQLICIYNKDGSISDKTAQGISAGSHSKAEWSCEVKGSGHSSYTAMIYSKTGENPNGCPTCAGRRVEIGINDLRTTHSEVASEILYIYEKNGVTIGSKTAQDVSAGSHSRAEFPCAVKESGHPSYSSTINNRTSKNSTSCPLCATGKTEGLFRDSFSQHAKNNFLSGRIPLDRQLFKSGMAQVDMLCEDFGLTIEYDGAWAHGGVKNANKNVTLTDCLARDADSTIALIKSGRKVIRIREWDNREKLPFVVVPAEYADSLYQVTYKSFGKDRDDIDELVKWIIMEKKDWFHPTAIQDNIIAPIEEHVVLV